MKTTVNIRDDLFRRAKARAALLGQSLGSFIEGALTNALTEKQTNGESIEDWIASLPKVSKKTSHELQAILDDETFREVDGEMWK